MNAQQQHDLQTAITSAQPLTEIVSLLRTYKDQGISQEEVYDTLATWRQTTPDEATEDRILEVADFVAGFCAAHMKIWDTPLPAQRSQFTNGTTSVLNRNSVQEPPSEVAG